MLILTLIRIIPVIKYREKIFIKPLNTFYRPPLHPLLAKITAGLPKNQICKIEIKLLFEYVTRNTNNHNCNNDIIII